MSFLLYSGVKYTLLPGVQRLNRFKSLRCVSTYSRSTNEVKEGSEHSKLLTYNPSAVEANWYEFWESRNYFKSTKLERNSFLVLLPPPNITGTLHLGHALTCTIQDVIVRWKRMKGESVVWIPGVDHAGIATQVAVEKHLKQTTGMSRYDLGREKFVKAIWEWKKEKEAKIIEQLRRMGASLDWSKLIFTLDSSHSNLVTKSFIQLFQDGLIYRKESLINWSCALKSSISDIEVDWITVTKKTDIPVPGYEKPVGFGYLYDIAYKVCDEGKDNSIVVKVTCGHKRINPLILFDLKNFSKPNFLTSKTSWQLNTYCKIPENLVFFKKREKSVSIKESEMIAFVKNVCFPDDEIVVSTTRPETMLGDVAIAIHPYNEAHSKFRDKFVWHPFRNEKIPIIVDEFVDQNIGTGAVKITPSHSFIDYEIAHKHNLPSIPVINEEGLINNVGTNEKFHGLKRFDARWAVIRELKELNLFRGFKSHCMKVPVCSRSGDVVEFLLKEQWFLNCKSLSEKAVDVVKSGSLKIVPESYKNVWFDWLSNKEIRDWNLSRQLWWGHQIPMYKCQYNDRTLWVPGLSLEEAGKKASKKFKADFDAIKIVQDPDVLDTWFSSGLLPLNYIIDQKRNPVISLMVTGHDILFFWLARMVMLSIQLKGQLPFEEVLLHGLVCDAKGKKMSKSVGNVIHPDDVINGLSMDEMERRLQTSLQEGRITEKDFNKALANQRQQFPAGIPECGVDALRFTLCSGTIHGYYTNFDIKKCQWNTFFCNKLQQGFNYFVKIADAYQEKRREFDLEDIKSDTERLNCFDFWILSRLANIVQIVEDHLLSYKLDRAADEIKSFIVDDFCNFYLNTTKPILEGCSSMQFKRTISVFFHCFETFLRLLCPFMPFFTEHLYQAMPLFNGYKKYESITVAKYPEATEWKKFQDEGLEDRFRKLSEFLTTVRRTKNFFNLKEEKKPTVLTECPDDLAELLFSDMHYVFKRLGDVENLARVQNLASKNVIRQEVEEDFIVFIEHKYDRATLQHFVQPLIAKEDEIKRSLDKLLKNAEDPNVSHNEKTRLSKKMDTLHLELKRIEEFKCAVNNCSR